MSPGTCYDIGDIASGKIPLAALTREHRVHYIKNHFVPGKQFQLSTYTLQRGDDRKVLSFQRAWLEQYKWLVYSSSQKGGYCKFCVLFPLKSSKTQSAVLVNAPMCKYNKATGKCGHLSVHENTDYHKDAVLQSLKLCEGVEHPERTLPNQISQANKQLYDINFHILKAIVKVILLCGRQSIALRAWA